MLSLVADLANVLTLEQVVLQDVICHLPHHRAVLPDGEVFLRAHASASRLHPQQTKCEYGEIEANRLRLEWKAGGEQARATPSKGQRIVQES